MYTSGHFIIFMSNLVIKFSIVSRYIAVLILSSSFKNSKSFSLLAINKVSRVCYLMNQINQRYFKRNVFNPFHKIHFQPCIIVSKIFLLILNKQRRFVLYSKAPFKPNMIWQCTY